MEARETGRLVTKATISALLQLLREDGGFLRQLHSRATVACCLLRLLTAVVRPTDAVIRPRRRRKADRLGDGV